MTLPRVVVLAWGNPSRGDDALGPEFLRCAEPVAATATASGSFEFVTDFQLQPEHATDLDGRDLALFVDASSVLASPIALTELRPQRDRTFTTHGMSPAAVLATFRAAFGREPPPAFQLAIAGIGYELGDPMSVAATRHLDAALALFARLAATPSAAAWRQLAQPG
jgi:hydrogenase maturation protease